MSKTKKYKNALMDIAIFPILNFQDEIPEEMIVVHNIACNALGIPPFKKNKTK